MSDIMRTFIAIELPEEVKAELEQLQADLRRRLAQAGLDRYFSWSNPAGFHLTLRFLGDTEAGRRAAIGQGLARIVREHGPFRLHLGGAGVFPNWSRMRVVWIGLDGDTDPLARLQAAVEALARSLGFEAETRGFSPHITLARVRRGAPPAELRQAAQVVQRWAEELARRPQTQSWPVDAVHYIRSQLSPQGARYTGLGRYPLGEGGEPETSAEE